MKEKIFDAEFFKKLENISIKATMSMTEGTAGGRKSKVKGSSVEFSDFREYSPGDDFRRIDWNAYGRFDKLFIKLFMEEREALINIFVDCSRSMDFGEKNKGAMALRISGILTYFALNNLDRVCINKLQGNTLHGSHSYMGKSTFKSALAFMERTEFEGSTNLSEAVKKKDLKNRGISIIISDFFTTGSIEEMIKYLAYKKQQIIFIQVICTEELSPDFGGEVRLIDSETGEKVNISITPKLLKAYNSRLNAMSVVIKEGVKKYGGTFMQVSTSNSLEKIIFEQFAREGII
ncbi:DUF58 domain-containing protein [Clostridium sp.]|jgi:uncharacterized protein (DUF58 family)|uniref:DUF58 domain-containing protein n=1 Tax=Clostridium sp. TaxID=1506 RepID=UPI003EEA8100